MYPDEDNLVLAARRWAAAASIDVEFDEKVRCVDALLLAVSRYERWAKLRPLRARKRSTSDLNTEEP